MREQILIWTVAVVPTSLNWQGDDMRDRITMLLKVKDVMIGKEDKFVRGEVFLSNNTKEPFSVEYRCDPRQYLEFDVIDSNGKKVSGEGYGFLFAPFEDFMYLKIAPGKKASLGSVNCVHTMKKNDSGLYRVQAVFTYGKLVIRSNTEQFRIEEKK